MKQHKIRKHYWITSCDECDWSIATRAKWRGEFQHEDHRMNMHPTFFDAMASVVRALNRFREAVGA